MAANECEWSDWSDSEEKILINALDAPEKLETQHIDQPDIVTQSEKSPCSKTAEQLERSTEAKTASDETDTVRKQAPDDTAETEATVNPDRSMQCDTFETTPTEQQEESNKDDETGMGNATQHLYESCYSDERIPLSSLIKKINSRMYKNDHKNNTQDQSTDDEMVIPLASLKAKMSNQDSQERSPSPCYDSDKDQAYKPKKEDINSSDSDNHSDIMEQSDHSFSDVTSNLVRDSKRCRSRAKKNLFASKDKQWKKKAKTIKRKTKNVKLRKEKTNEATKNLQRIIKEHTVTRNRKTVKLGTTNQKNGKNTKESWKYI